MDKLSVSKEELSRLRHIEKWARWHPPNSNGKRQGRGKRLGKQTSKKCKIPVIDLG